MLRLYNTLSHSIEEFKPITDMHVGMYSCGPTVYDYQHIGHMRRYVGDDILVRVLRANGYSVKHVMNITDVGHLVSDADEGEDKMEKGAKKFGKSVWEVAKMFEEQFWASTDALDIERPDKVMHATDYIQDQIELVQTLEEKGYTYRTSDGIYFDTSKFSDYFKLSRQNPQELKAGARVDMGEKKNVSDFALWKFSYPKGVSREEFLSTPDMQLQNTSGVLAARQMEWESPWGVGFPGWHIECSAMSMKELGNTFDIHTGGIDHIAIHHSNEIAQSECATGQQFVRYWVHHNFLVVENTKMSKSLGNFITVQDVQAKGYDPLSLRYLYLQTHYRQEMNFTWEALEASEKALQKLVKEVSTWEAPKIGCAEFEERFLSAVNDDLNTSAALAIVWEMVRSDYPASAKAASMKQFDKALGLQLFEKAAKLRAGQTNMTIPQEVMDLVQQREALRKLGNWDASDELRAKVQDLGFEIKDTKEGPQLTPLK